VPGQTLACQQLLKGVSLGSPGLEGNETRTKPARTAGGDIYEVEPGRTGADRDSPPLGREEFHAHDPCRGSQLAKAEIDS
jgi:hypothetical protein